MAARLRWRAFALLAVLLVSAHTLLPTVGGKTYQASAVDDDVVTYFRPLTHSQFRAAHETGSIPEWFDRGGLGYPSAQEGQHGENYPPRILMLRVAPSPGFAANALVYLHRVLTVLGVFFLVFALGLSFFSAVIGAVAYAVSSQLAVWAPFYHTPAFYAALPWALAAVESLARRKVFPAPLATVLLALSVGMLGLGTHLQLVHLAFQAIAFVAGIRFVQIWRAEGRAAAGRFFALAGTGFGLGLIVALPCLVPFALEQLHSTRQQTPIGAIAGIEAWNWLTFFFPMPFRYNMNFDVFVGPLAFILLPLGAWRARREARILPYSLLVLACILVGHKTPLFSMIYHLVPGWRVISNVARVSFVITLPMVVLIARGWEAAAERIPARFRGGAWVVLLFAQLAAGIWVQGVRAAPAVDLPQARFAEWLPMVEAQDDGGAWTSLCQPYATDRFLYRPIAFAESPRGRWFDTYDSFLSDRYVGFWRILTGAKRFHEPVGGQWYQHIPEDGAPNQFAVNGLGISRLLVGRQCGRELFPADWKEVAGSEHHRVLANPNAFPFAYLSGSWRGVKDFPEAQADYVKSAAAGFARHEDFLEGSSPGGAAGLAKAVEWRRSGPERVELRWDAPLMRPTLVVVLESFHQNWVFNVNGVIMPAIPVNGFFLGVILPAGARSVVAEFRPTLIWRLREASWAMGAALLLLALGLSLKAGLVVHDEAR